MNRVNVDYENKQIVSDIFTLTDVVTNESLSFIPSDSEGNFNYRGISKNPIMRNAMQTSQTAGEWSDLEYPWMAIPQEDWTGGRANLRFTLDKSRFYDSYRAQSAFNSVIYNAPLDYYSTGYRKAITNYPGNVHWKKVTSGKPLNVKFHVGEMFVAGEVYILLRRRGNPTAPLVVSGIGSGYAYTIDEITDTVSELKKFETSVPLPTGDYTLSISSDSNSKDYWEVGCTSDKIDGVPYFRVAESQQGYMVRFFQYEQVMFMVRQKPNGTPRLWMNGNMGTVASWDRSLGNVKLTVPVDENVYSGARIGLVYGHGIEGQHSVWRTIVGNNNIESEPSSGVEIEEGIVPNTEIQIDEPWDVTPEEGAVFVIVDTPLWSEIADHGLTSAVTDVHVARNIVYFAQGDYTPIRYMRWDMSIGDFVFSELNDLFREQEIEYESTLRASFIQSVRDSAGMMLYFAQNDGEGHRRTIYRSHLTDRLDADIVTTQWSESGTIDKDTGTKLLGVAMVVEETNTIDFKNGDTDFSGYVVEMEEENFNRGDDGSGKLMLTLQESVNGEMWNDVTSYTLDNGGKHIFYAHCKYRYRRMKAIFTGKGSVKLFTVTPSDAIYLEDAIKLIDNYGKITRLFEYGAEQEKFLWIAQEGMMSSINKTNGTYHLDRINLDELATTAEEWNGKAVATSDVYLLWSWLNGLQRYYNTQLEGKGPDHDEGLPHNMRGRITQILSYPSNFFVSIDGGEDGYSSVFMFNGNGWHNLYTAANKGERIFDIAFQSIYGNRPDRLWVQLGSDIIWLTMPSKILYALQDPNAEYTHESVLTSSWITGGMAEVKKLWQSLTILADYLEPGVCWIEADYQLDNENNPWIEIPTNPYNTSPQEEKALASSDGSVNGYRLRYRLRLQSSDIHKTPKVNVVLLKAIGIIEIKYSYGFTARNIKYKPDLMGEYEEIEPYEVDEILDRWARELRTLRLNSVYRIYDDKRVFLEAPQTSVLNEKSEGYLQQITCTEI